MKVLRHFMSKGWLRNQLLHAEADARLHSTGSNVEDPIHGISASFVPQMTEEDEVRYRRVMAKLHYGEETAIPEYEALLTEGEKDYLDGYEPVA
jgi:hypothetical protein